MVSKKRKRIKNKHLHSNLSLILTGILFFAIIGFLVFSNLRIGQRRKEMTRKIEDLTKEIQLLEEKNQELKEGIFDAESDVFWEAKLYEQGYKKPGEEAIVVIPTDKEEEEILSEEKAFFENLLDWVLMRQ